MITLNGRFTLHRDKYNWVLAEKYLGQDKNGSPKNHTRETYHPWPDKAVRYMCEQMAQDVGSWGELLRLYEDAAELLRSEGEITRELCREIALLRSQTLERDRTNKPTAEEAA